MTGESRVLLDLLVAVVVVGEGQALLFATGEGVGLPLTAGDDVAVTFEDLRGIGLMGRLAFSMGGECTTNAQVALASSSELLCFLLVPARTGDAGIAARVFLNVGSTRRDLGLYFGSAEPAPTATFLGLRTEEVLLSAGA